MCCALYVVVCYCLLLFVGCCLIDRCLPSLFVVARRSLLLVGCCWLCVVNGMLFVVCCFSCVVCCVLFVLC